MERKPEGGHQYIRAATSAIKNTGPLRELYIAIHGVDPDRKELQQFANRLNPARSNPGADMLGICIAHLPVLHNMTVREFFGISVSSDGSDHTENG